MKRDTKLHLPDCCGSQISLFIPNITIHLITYGKNELYSEVSPIKLNKLVSMFSNEYDSYSPQTDHNPPTLAPTIFTNGVIHIRRATFSLDHLNFPICGVELPLIFTSPLFCEGVLLWPVKPVWQKN